MSEGPTISFDAHFARVPGIIEVDFNPNRCMALLAHPLIGLTLQEMSRLHLYVRPDYDLAYTHKERRAIRSANPEDYTDAASCEIIEPGDPLGTPGHILMTLVYGAGYGINELLCHEAIHARTLLRKSWWRELRDSFLEDYTPYAYNSIEAAEETEADSLMDNVVLRGLRKGVISIRRAKSKK